MNIEHRGLIIGTHPTIWTIRVKGVVPWPGILCVVGSSHFRLQVVRKGEVLLHFWSENFQSHFSSFCFCQDIYEEDDEDCAEGRQQQHQLSPAYSSKLPAKNGGVLVGSGKGGGGGGLMTRVKGGAPHVLQLPPPPGQTAQSRGQHHFRVNKAPSLASALYKLENRYQIQCDIVR